MASLRQLRGGWGMGGLINSPSMIAATVITLSSVLINRSLRLEYYLYALNHCYGHYNEYLRLFKYIFGAFRIIFSI